MKVRVTAAKRGSFVSPGSGTIYRFNPDSKNEAARRPVVEEEDLPELVNKRLIVDPTKGGKGGKGGAGKAEPAVVIPDATAEDVARARVAATSKIDDAAGPGATGLSTMAATNFDPNSSAGKDQAALTADPPHIDEGLSGDDPDAPPAPAAKPKAEKAPK